MISLGWCIARLPWSWIRAIGSGCGRLFYRFARQRRHIAEVNLALCFPDLDQAHRDALVLQNFRQVAVGAIELMVPWLNPNRDLQDRFDIIGAEHLHAALAKGRGVLLIGGHYATLDIIAQPLASLGDVDVMYRFHKNPAWEWLQTRGRGFYFDGVIERQDTRQTLRRLKQGRAIWYAADQDYGPRHSIFAPFFGIPAATIVATARFAKLNHSPVLMLRQTRDLNAMRWTLEFSPEIEDFPSGDDQADATRMNALLEDSIRRDPDQYLWLHKRFKTRPAGEPSFYRLS